MIQGDVRSDMCNMFVHLGHQHPCRGMLSWSLLRSSCMWVPRDNSVSSGHQGPKVGPEPELRLYCVKQQLSLQRTGAGEVFWPSGGRLPH